MAHYRYLIVGGGMTGDAAVQGLRERDPQGSVGMISAETDAPYARPPLSKGLWKGKPLESIWRRTEEAGVDLHLGRRVMELDPRAKRVRDDAGTTHTYDRLLLATGGTPRRLPFGGDDVIYFRTLADYRRLRALAAPGQRVAVIGGGFIGSEIAAGLAMQGCRVTLLFPEAGIGARVFPADLARHLVDVYREHDVDVRPGTAVKALHRQGPSTAVETGEGEAPEVEAVVAGIGLVPETKLAEAAGLTVEDGIVVDAHLRTSAPDVYAAGDVARFPSAVLGRAMRVEHEDNAVTMGRAAGRAMAGDDAPYTHLPYFYSDLFDLGYEAVGELDARLDVVADWQEPYRKGVLYYLRGDDLRGVLLWNTWDQVDAARALIGERHAWRAGDLAGRLPAPAA